MKRSKINWDNDPEEDINAQPTPTKTERVIAWIIIICFAIGAVSAAIVNINNEAIRDIGIALVIIVGFCALLWALHIVTEQ